MQKKDENNEKKEKTKKVDGVQSDEGDEWFYENSKPKEPPPKKHWFRDNWILLSFLSMVSFSSANLVIGTLAKLPGL